MNTALLNRQFFDAINHGNLNFVENLLRQGFDPSFFRNYAIGFAAAKGQTNIMERLLRDARVDPSANNNVAIQWASGEGHLDAVDMLLKDARVVNLGLSVIAASQNGRANVLERLLCDARVDATNDRIFALILSATHGHNTIVDFLLHKTSFDPSVLNNAAIFMATQSCCAADNVLISSFPSLYRTIDLIYQDLRVYSTIKRSRVVFTHIQMFRTRMFHVCVALQNLNLPDLQKLKIIDQLIPNTVRRWAKIELIRKVKHFRV